MIENAPACRFCGEGLRHDFADLGMSPLANRYLRAEELRRMEPFYPLHARVCSECLLVQVEDAEKPEEIFSDYAYFSSYSDTWLEHARQYARSMAARYSLNAGTQVIEIASNDGYLLRFFQELGIPVLGIEPAANVAAVAREAGIPTMVEFFSRRLAAELAANGTRAALLAANNVLAHVPDLNDFVAGMKVLLAEDGVITIEAPHLLRLIAQNQFDTIYHEHFSYFSLHAAQRILGAHGLHVFHVEELPTHGGSLRIYAAHAERGRKDESGCVAAILRKEAEFGLTRLETYTHFAGNITKVKADLLEFLIDAKRQAKSVAAYGAPAKGNTLLNYCGIRTDLIEFTVDRSPHKQGKFLPGTHIPVFHPDRIAERKPDYLLILPWNIKEEIMTQMAAIRNWGGRFVTAIPRLEVHS